MPAISIIIPTWNRASELERLLRSIGDQQMANLEVIVVDRHSTDGTGRVAEKYGAKLVDSEVDRALARNMGAAAASAQLLLFLDSDMELTPGVLQNIQTSIQNADAVCVREITIAADNYWSRCTSFERDGYFGTLYWESARCIRKTTFDCLGGYDPQMTGLEDMDLQARLVEHGARISWVSAPIYHYDLQGGLIKYLTKRGEYGLADRAFSIRNPRFRGRMWSVRGRAYALLRRLFTSRNVSDLRLIPGILFVRAAELVVRRSVALRLEVSLVASC